MGKKRQKRKRRDFGPKVFWSEYDNKLLCKLGKHDANGDDWKRIHKRFIEKSKCKTRTADGLRQHFLKLSKNKKQEKNEDDDDDSEESDDESEDSKDTNVKYKNYKKRVHQNEQFEISESDEEDDDIEIVETLKSIQKIESLKRNKRKRELENDSNAMNTNRKKRKLNEESDILEWTCDHCTFLNKQIVSKQDNALKCDVCRNNITVREAQAQSKKIAVKQWLTDKVALPQYFDLFIQEGFDDIDTIENTVTKEDLLEIGIEKPGHRNKIMLFVQRLKQRNDNNNEACA